MTSPDDPLEHSSPPACLSEPVPADEAARAWRRAQEQFFELADAEEDERERALLALEAEDEVLAAAVRGLLESDPGPDPPRRFGPYVELRPIGAGGMGEVVLARRDDGEFEREVAVKLLAPGAGSTALFDRFLQERQTLAALEHESIVRLLDGGTTEDGRPYFVMEYVDGVALDRFVEARGLDLRARLRLFRRILDPVAHAHERGIVHRDLKPANVLVRTDGSVRLVDFGIARTLSSDSEALLTRTGQRVFTPEYASPEQILGETISPATDVFALGIMLYELASGTRPWRAKGGTRALEEEVLAAPPVPPSRRTHGTRRRALRGDLDTILSRCMQRDPDRRYGDAAELALDLDRHLGGQTILARPTSAMERAVRLVRRRPWQAAAAMFALAALGTSAGLLAEKRSTAKRVEALIQGVPDRIQSARQLLAGRQFDSAQTEILGLIADARATPGVDPIHLAQTLTLRSTQLVQVGDYEAALLAIEEARVAMPQDHPKCAEILANLAYEEMNAFLGLQRSTDADRSSELAMQLVETGLSAEHPLRFGVGSARARLLTDLGRAPEACLILEPLTEDAQAILAERDRVLGHTFGQYGRALLKAGRPKEAIAPLRRGLAVLRWNHGDRNRDVAEVATYLAEALMGLGRFEEAAEPSEHAVDAYREVGDPNQKSFSLDVAARIANALGQRDRALLLMREALPILETGGPALRPHWHATQYQIGWILVREEDIDGALEALQFALSGDETTGLAVLGPTLEGQARMTYAEALGASGDREAAQKELDAALPLIEVGLGKQHPIAQQLRARMGQ